MTHPTGPGHPGPDPGPIGPHGPRIAEASVLAVLHAAGGYPDLCRTGRYGTPYWHAVLTCCLACGSADGCSCDEYAAHAARLLAHPITALSAPAVPVAAGPTPGGTR